MAAKSFRDLNVYKKALVESGRIFVLTQLWPNDERFGLIRQVRRSSRAVPALVAEAWARRHYEQAFISSINQALGEATETQAWLDIALESGYFNERTHADVNDQWQIIGAMLQKMIHRSDQFVPLNKAKHKR